MSDQRWTLGFAVYDKPPYYVESVRATFTAMDAVIGQPRVSEVVIVLNGPPDPKNPLRDLPDKTGGLVKVFDMPTPVGTAAPRNKVFELAMNRRVAVCDPHVKFYPGFFEALDEMYDGLGDDCPDLLHGPLMTEKPWEYHSHHLNDQWRAEMWGTWGWAWQTPAGQLFSTMTPDDRELRYVTLGQPGGQRPLMPDELAAMSLPALAWTGHERVLWDRGCTQPTEPFLIPDHGMGFFACLKDKWLPFHAECEGFGGEEMTTGYRFRRSGRNVWCVPGAKWWHHFYRANGGAVPYPLVTWHKMRNYVHEFRALGMSVEPIRQHFVPHRCHPGEWDKLLSGMRWPDHTPGVDASTLSRNAEESHRRTGGVPTGHTR